ncbi:MAG TPA: MmcQ/YjbR family DNA-binding protein [Candidatus Kapabacteria bacterium]|jgi:predicted DNA-binding protein (MmcQ/YjbR family)|nr:MmcQ/YjbR family DNA-binding protein [Candidatus Kapabacteria bacterium]
MDAEELHNFCLSLPEATFDFPFDEDTVCYRICNKIFALGSLEKVPLLVNLKCSPDIIDELREKFSCIRPGYHMNKRNWNTVVFDGVLSNTALIILIQHSYAMTFRSLTKKHQAIALQQSPEIKQILDNFSTLELEKIR